MRYTVKAKYRPNYGGFRRSGKYWSNGGLEVDESEVTAEMIAEPMLIIEPITATADIPAKPVRKSRRGK